MEKKTANVLRYIFEILGLILLIGGLILKNDLNIRTIGWSSFVVGVISVAVATIFIEHFKLKRHFGVF